MPKPLLALRPEWGLIPGQSDHWWLLFDCPLCGPPSQVYVQFRRAAVSAPGIWEMKSPLTQSEFGAYPDMRNLTLAPSIGEPPHGRRRCTWHGSIIDGVVTP
jgi:hypothetical protein